MASDPIDTAEAAAIIGVSVLRIQQLCRAYLETGEGLVCSRVGTGRRSVYLVSRGAAEQYRDQERKRGWKKGRKRNGMRGVWIDDV